MNRIAVCVGFVLLLVTAGVGPATATNGQDGTARVGTNPAQVTAESCSFPVSATDATGTNVTVSAEPQRVVALGPDIAQTMWEIGARGKVVGMPMNQYTAYLNGSKSRTDVYQSDGYTVAPEKVVGQNPDLVLAANIVPNQTVRKLRGAGLTVYKFDFANSFSDIYAKTNQTGRLVGACRGANRTASVMKTRVETVRQAVGNESTPSALYQQSGGFVAGNGTFISDIIETAGAENLAANAGIQGYQEISNEVIASRNPEWIITSNRSFIPENGAYASTTALQQNQTILVNPNYISQPAPRVVIPLTKIARQLHPDAMASANLSATPIGSVNGTANATPAQPATTTGANATTPATTASGTSGTAATTTAATASGAGGTTAGGATQAGSNGTAGGNATGTTSSNGPGFGIAVAVVAVLGGALLARRRT